MKQFVVRNMQGQKGFCKYHILEDGMLEASFFLPIYQFSIYWPLNKKLIKVVRVVNTKDKRKTIVVFHIHPVAWLGKNFSERRYLSPKDSITRAFNDFINIY